MVMAAPPATNAATGTNHGLLPSSHDRALATNLTAMAASFAPLLLASALHPRVAGPRRHQRGVRALQRPAGPERGRLHLWPRLRRQHRLLLRLHAALPLQPPPQPCFPLPARCITPQGPRDLPPHRQHHHRLQSRCRLLCWPSSLLGLGLTVEVVSARVSRLSGAL